MQLDTRQEQAQLAAAEAQRELARLNLDRADGPAPTQGIVVAGRARPRRAPRTSRPRRGWARSAPPSSARRSARRSRRPRHPPGQPRPVPARAAIPVVPLQSLDPIYVNFSRAAAGGRPRCAPGGAVQVTRRGRRRRASSTGRITAVDSVVDEATRNVQVQATLRQPATAACARACSCETQVVAGRAASAVVAAARLRDQLRALRRLGLRRRATSKGPNGETLPRRAPAVREAGRRARRPGGGALRPQAGRGGRDLGRLQAAQRRRRRASTTRSSPRNEPGARSPRTTEPMKIHRPLHPPAGPGHRRQPGHPDRRAAVDPLAERAPVPAQRHRGHPGDDRLRRRQRRPRARLHHHAARARDRERRRHRLHRVVERAGR